jgi:uncharacterized protein (TIGR00725 family)
VPLARLGVHLLTGGGGGTMEAVARGFVSVASRRGLSLAILPADEAEPGRAPRGYPNPHVEIAIRTQLPLRGARGAEPLSRNHLNVLSADALVALPGGPGTRSELELALRYERPLVAWWPDGVAAPRGVRLAATLAEVEAFLGEQLGSALALRDALP